MIKEILRSLRKYLFDFSHEVIVVIDRGYGKTTVLQSLMIAKENRKKERIKNLSEVEFSGFSQWGEDGIIDWLIEKLPDIPKTFIEFGVENYTESNTRMLLHLRNWRGCVIDGSEKHILNIKQQEIYWRFDLTAICAFIDRDNINNLIESAGLAGEIGLLSVDIDGNDYWIWQAIEVVRPVIVVCEYNAVFGDLHPISIPYKADFNRTDAHFSNLYFGASLPALIELGEKKGYSFVGTNSNGVNAFFVRRDFAPSIMSSLDEIISHPSKFREARDSSGNLSVVSGSSRLDIISHLPVFAIETQSINAIGDMGNLYSAEWQTPK
jgi:hypothetical protein